MKKFLMIFVVFMAPLFAFAQEVTDTQVFMELFNLIGGFKGLTTLAAVLAIVQLIVKFFKSPLGYKVLDKIPDKYEFILIQGLSIIVAYITLLVTGVTGMEALVKTIAMPVVVEYFFKIYKLIAKKP